VTKKIKWELAHCIPTPAVKTKNNSRMFIIELSGRNENCVEYVHIKIWTKNIKKALVDICLFPRTPREIKSLSGNEIFV